MVDKCQMFLNFISNMACIINVLHENITKRMCLTQKNMKISENWSKLVEKGWKQ